MAPEQLAGPGASIDVRTDVFGIGGILYELLIGEAPNDRGRLAGPGLSRHPVELPSTSATWGPIPPVLARIAAKALAPDPANRYQDVMSLRADLDGFLKGGGWFETRACDPGQFIVKEGEAGDAAYIIESGHCEVTKIVRGADTVIRQLGPGDVFGETAVLTRAQRTATVRALDAVTLKVITAESLNFELEQNPWLAVFVRSLAGLFREADARLARDDS